ncbi:hypothetical protein GCM10011504_45560 [Siccirubricoccus deserti]|nr:hypothetical protein GCM10011504_45560 [Siccirubricoccus deserti]
MAQGYLPDGVWISLLAPFHGLRREDVCQLLKSDVRQTDGIWRLHITTPPDSDDLEDAAEMKRLKTESADLHPDTPTHPRCGLPGLCPV